MENVGNITLIVSEKLKKAFFGNTNINESSDVSKRFMDVVKSSPLLQLEFKVFNALDSKHINDDFTATRFIDNNIKLFETYTVKELTNERKKLSSFVDESVKIDEKKKALYDSINNLIMESLAPSDEVNVDVVHEAFSHILTHIKTPLDKRTDILVESMNIDKINNDIIEIAIRKFNDKYSDLNEDDKNLLVTLIKSSDSEKKELFETYKTEAINLLGKIDDPTAFEKRDAVLEKVNGITYDPKLVNESIIKLHELKMGLL